MPRTKKKDSLEEVLKKYNVRKASDAYYQLRRVPTGCLAFDRLIGGGLPLGRYTEVYGQQSVLKTTIAARAVSAFQKAFLDTEILWIDSEGSYDPAWMGLHGVDNDRVSIIKTDTGEDTIEVVDVAMQSRAFSLFVIDSISALTPTRELEYDPQDDSKAMGAAGKMTSQMMRRWTRHLDNEHNAMYIINQQRDKIGVSFGDPSVTTGGRAIPYYAGVRVELRNGEKQREDVVRTAPGSGKGTKRRIVVSRTINMRVEKDKCGPRENATQALLLDTRDVPFIDEEDSILTIGIEDGLVERNGAKVTLFPGSSREHSVQGWDNAKRYLVEHDKIRSRLRRRIVKKSVGLGSVSGS